MYTLTQFTKVYKKRDLIAWSNHSTSLKALPFLSFHKVHIKHKGAALHAFSLFLPTKESCHPSKFLLTEECKTHCTLKREKNQNSQHSSLATKQGQVVGSFLLFFAQVAPIQDIPTPFFSWSMVRILLQDTSQAKKLTLTGAQHFQMILHRNGFLQALVQKQ